jgi:hypothetical protein
MSPRAKHTSEDSRTTTFKLNVEERAAIDWIRLARKTRGNARDRMNDILVDGLWDLLAKEGGSKEQIRAILPKPPAQPIQDKVTEMPKKPRGR